KWVSDVGDDEQPMERSGEIRRPHSRCLKVGHGFSDWGNEISGNEDRRNGGEGHDWLSEKIGKLEMKPSGPDQPPPLVQSATNVAKQMVEAAEKHWPKPGGGTLPPKTPPPPLRSRPRRISK